MTTPPDPGTPDGAAPDKLRRRIAAEAGRMLGSAGDSHRARLRAARRVARAWVPEERLPDHGEIRRAAGAELKKAASDPPALAGDRFDDIAALVRMLATVNQDPVKHPEGDALEHTLQVFELVRGQRPYDEELLTAALVFDVGRAIDRGDAVAAALAALAGLVTERTRWFVEALPAARARAAGTLGHRARLRLESHPDFADLELLAEADRRGRVRGGESPSLDEAIAAVRALDAESAD
jgi:hypothetical protein